MYKTTLSETLYSVLVLSTLDLSESVMLSKKKTPNGQKTTQTRIRNTKKDKTDFKSGGAGSYANSPYNQKNTFLLKKTN